MLKTTLNKKLNTVLICPNPQLARQVQEAMEPLDQQVSLCGVVPLYPNAEQLDALLRLHSPSVVMVSFEQTARGVAISRYLEQWGAGIQVLAVHDSLDAGRVQESMRSGAREFLSPPFETATLAEAFARAADCAAEHPPQYLSSQPLYSFLPARAGVGASTLALNLAYAMAAAIASANEKVWLGDLDLHSGMVRFMLKLENMRSMTDAIELAGNLDQDSWSRLVTNWRGLDVLHAGTVNPNIRIDPTHLGRLLDFVQERYHYAFCDLSCNLEQHALDVMARSRQVFLVTTPERSSLEAAREKAAFLKTLRLESRTVVLLNRAAEGERSSALAAEQVEQLLGLPVACSFPNTYELVNRSLAEGETVEPHSPLGLPIAAFAHALAGRQYQPAPPQKRALWDLFSLSHAKNQPLAKVV